MNLKNLSDSHLIESLNKLVSKERELLIEILYFLREIERRRLFSELGYKSLFEFTVKSLSYSEDQAYRRISAMRLLKEIPEMEEKIHQGRINLSHLSMAQSYFRKEEKLTSQKMPKEEKLLLMERLEQKSIREAESLVSQLSSNPELHKADAIKVNATCVEFKFEARKSILNKIELLKGKFAHTHPGILLGELFEKLCDSEIEKSKAPWTFRKTCVKTTGIKATGRKAAGTNATVTSATETKESKAEIIRSVRRRANYQCEICFSTYALEIDHIFPKAKGGGSEKENLRLLCRSCNQRAAIRAYGVSKMETYLR